MMQSPTFVGQFFGDRFLDLWRFGVPQIDLWKPERSDVPAPPEPVRPSHERPERPLPAYPIVSRDLTDEEADLSGEVSSREALQEANLYEYFSYGKSSPESDEGYRLCAEGAANAIEDGHPPSWWDPTRHTAEALSGLIRKMDAYDTAKTAAEKAHYATVRAIQAAPDADPEWRAYDEAQAAWPAAWAAYLERVRLRAIERTGYASKEEAEKEWAERGRAEVRRLSVGGREG